MTVEFDDLDRPRGKWRLKYGQHLGFCMRKFNINWNWKDVSEGKRKLMWEDTMNARQGKIFLMSKLNKGSVLLFILLFVVHSLSSSTLRYKVPRCIGAVVRICCSISCVLSLCNNPLSILVHTIVTTHSVLLIFIRFLFCRYYY
ncbi:hypothetical protein RND81_01G058900 [Saponaria officinalis]|uniref:Transmembrane protein n=1 Tax=Saponaria officinalis TaxID=3572 RepID=A0AAW1N658_SAPOF